MRLIIIENIVEKFIEWMVKIYEKYGVLTVKTKFCQSFLTTNTKVGTLEISYCFFHTFLRKINEFSQNFGNRLRINK